MRMRRWSAGFALLLLSFVGPTAVRADTTCESEANFGAILDPADGDQAVKALPPAALFPERAPAILPERVMLENLPMVAQQGTLAEPGSPGSCEAQSFGYGLGSYTAARDEEGRRKWNPALPRNAASAAWLYSLIHSRTGAECPTGSRGIDYLEQLTAYGAATRAEVPYRPKCTYLDKVKTSPRPGMERLRIGSYAVIPVSGNDDAVATIKAHLAAGQAVAFTGLVLCGYALKPSFENGVIYETETVLGSGHGQLLVGYDNRIGSAGRPGAFLVQNSFGTSWPPRGRGSVAPPGMAYWSYGTFAGTQLLAAVAYPRRNWPVGPRLSPSRAGAPQAWIARAYQWSATGGGASYLIFNHDFGEPVRLESLAITEPGVTPVTATAVYGQYIASGYSYLRRSDGKSFLPGVYRINLSAIDLSGRAVSYSGSLSVGPLAGLSAASMAGSAVRGPTGAAAVLSGGP